MVNRLADVQCGLQTIEERLAEELVQNGIEQMGRWKVTMGPHS